MVGSPSNSYMPTRRKARKERTVEVKKTFIIFASITTGKVGTPHLPVARQRDKIETNQMLKVALKKNRRIFFFRVMLCSLGYVLSALTTIVAVVACSALTDLAVVVISKSNRHVPSTSRVTAAGSGDAIVIVHAVCPTL